MQRDARWFVLLVVLAAIAAVAAPRSAPKNLVQGPLFLNGLEDTPFAGQGVNPPRDHISLDDPIVPPIVVGTTWYDNQHNGTMGRQVAVDREGYVHHAWMRGMQSGSASRHVFYNIWSPESQAFMLPSPDNHSGVQVDAAARAGFVTLDVNDMGFAFPTYHEGSGDVFHAVTGMDFYARFGGFQSFRHCPDLSSIQLIWPTSAIDRNGDIHAGLTQSGGDGLEFYSKVRPWISSEQTGDSIQRLICQETEQASFITIDVAASPVSDRIALAWIVDPTGDNIGTDIHVQISEDGGLNWGEVMNITGFHEVDTTCVTEGGDPNVCNGDTMRPWIELNLLIDDQDRVHVAFSASGFYWWDYDGTPLSNHGYVFSSIWHWDDHYSQFNLVHQAWYAHTSVSLGVNNLMTDRPSLSVDTLTGFLYCAYRQFDSVQVSLNGFPQSDAWMSVSTNRGRTWSEGINVSNTDGGIDTPAGQCRSERDITLAKFVSGGIIHMQYMLDLDAGMSIATTPEGVPTNNDILYLRIPTSLIPTTPLMPLYPLRADSTGFPFDLLAADRDHSLPPREFALYQNFPNPFNPSTQIQFDLARAGRVSLKVFDITGREAATLLDNASVMAGTHVYSFEGTDLASGVYLCRLTTPEGSETRKMVLMK